jgi:hypothetical protein
MLRHGQALWRPGRQRGWGYCSTIKRQRRDGWIGGAAAAAASLLLLLLRRLRPNLLLQRQYDFSH